MSEKATLMMLCWLGRSDYKLLTESLHDKQEVWSLEDSIYQTRRTKQKHAVLE